MKKLNHSKPRKGWETTYPYNGPRDFPFRVVLDKPFEHIENPIEKDHLYKENRSEITSWIRNHKIKCDFTRETYRERRSTNPTGSRRWIMWSFDYEVQCYRDVYAFVRESDAVAFKLLFG